MSVRTITLFSTKGMQKAKLETAVTTWGELKPLVKKAGYDVDNLHATESIKKLDLNHPDGVLPAEAFTLFLRPKKTKSGLDVKGLGFKELRQIVKDNKDDIAFMDHINSTGNYTRIKTETLAELLSTWKGKSSKKVVVAASVVEKVSKSSKKAKKVNKKNKSKNRPESVNVQEVYSASDKLEQVQTLLEEIKEDVINEETKDSIDTIFNDLAVLKVLVEEDSETPEQAEDARLAKEAEELCEKMGC